MLMTNLYKSFRQFYQVKPKNVSENFLSVESLGDALVTGTITKGIMNGISLYSNVLLARYIHLNARKRVDMLIYGNINSRIALSWFPQLFNQFPILRPIITVTEPYLKAFRRTIPPIAGLFVFQI